MEGLGGKDYDKDYRGRKGKPFGLILRDITEVNQKLTTLVRLGDARYKYQMILGR